MDPRDRDDGIRSKARTRVGPDGGSLTLPNGKGRVDFPKDTFGEEVDVEFADISPIAPYGQFERSLLAFRVEVADAAGSAIHAIGKPATLTVSYADDDVRGINRSTLGRYHWNGDAKRWDPLEGKHDLRGHALTAEVAAFSEVGMWGDPYHVVPATIKDFETDLYSGSASVAIPLEVPPGPNGFGAKLTLTYSSGRTNEMKSRNSRGSWVSVGWSLSLGSIQYDDGNNRHSIDLNGVGDELIDMGNGQWRTKHESFLKIERLTAPAGFPYWQVKDKSGTLYRFGFKADTRQGSQILVNNGSHQFHKTWDGVSYGEVIYRWDLDYVKDPDGNEMEVDWEGITYFDCSGSELGWCEDYDKNAYPKEIRYSLNDAGGPQRKIVFDLAARSDSAPTFVTEMRKLTDIRMYVGSDLVRRYHFDYEETNNYLVLTALTQYGSDNSTSLPKWTFTYAHLDFRYYDYYHPEREQIRNRAFLETADNGQGGKVKFYHEHIPADYWAGYIGWTRQRVWKKEVFDGLAATPLATTYAYDGFGEYHAPDDEAWERTEFRGHDRVTATCPDNHVRHHHYYKGMATNWPRACEDGSPIGSGAYSDTAPDTDGNLLEGKEFEVVTRVGASGSAVIARTYRRWEVVNNHPRSPGDRQYLQGYTISPSYPAVIRRRTDYSYDSYGNVTGKEEFGQTDAHYYRKTVIDYFNMYNLAAYIVDKPRQINVYEWDSQSQTDVLISRKSYYYDDLGWSQAPTKGHVSLLEDGVAGQLATVRKYGYNRYDVYEGFPYGNTRWVRDANGNVAETVYDSTYHTFPTSVVDPLLRATTTQYDYRLGKPTYITDPNGAVTRHAYDVFGRIVRTWKPGDDNTLDAAATIVYRYHTATVPNKVTVGVRKDAGGGLWPRRRYRHVFYDGLGRQVQAQTDFDTSSCLIRTADVSQLRSGVNVHNPGQSWTDQPVTTATRIKALHYTELRSAGYPALWLGQGLWNGISLGPIPDWSSGATPQVGSLIYLADLIDLRLWLNQYEIKKPAAETAWSNNAGAATVVNTYYDSLGRKARETTPRNLQMAVLGKFSRSDWDNTGNPDAEYAYDVLGRATQITAPGGEITITEHLGWIDGPAGEGVTRTRDPNGHVKEHLTDPFGRLVRVREYSGVWPNQVLYATTTYSYNGRDQLIKVVDAQGNQTVIEYDILGRKTRMHDPDMCGSSDPNSAAYWWAYVYDANGNMTRQTDAKGQVITFEQYDALNRVRYKKNNGGATLAEFVYDEIGGSFSGFSGLGRRTTMKFGPGLANSVKSYYDPRGRAVKADHTLDGVLYTTQATYDALDRMLTITHSNGEVVTYKYGDHGLPVSLQSSVRGVIVSNVTYNALGKPFDLALGNGLLTQNRYWGIDYGSLHYGMLRSIVSGGLQSLTYGYDAIGNVMSLDDYNGHGPIDALSLAYDHLDRLTSVAGGIG